uniref:Uncharacterized protein n=1 Tax=Anguilla anguilla TaxID=7936 RepID=A0A0E9VBA4_ANGAN
MKPLKIINGFPERGSLAQLKITSFF